MATTPSVLFVCVHNAGRSQMAQGFLAHLVGDRGEVRSAGTEPADHINPAAIEAIAEIGIDITAHTPKILTPDTVETSDIVVTMGCGDTCPYFPGIDYRDRKLDDPAEPTSTLYEPPATTFVPASRNSSPNYCHRRLDRQTHPDILPGSRR